MKTNCLIFLLNKVILSRIFRFYLVFCVIGVWFVISLLWLGVVHRLVATFYLCGGDLNKQNIFDQLNISNYDGY